MTHSRNPGYISGSHWVVCDVCGFDTRIEDIQKRWDGLLVCSKDFESRHPNDMRKAVTDDPTATDIRIHTPALAYGLPGDTSPTLVVGTDKTIQLFSSALTANRTITLDTAAASDYDRFEIIRTGGGAFTLDVGGLITLVASLDAEVIVEYRGSSWHLISYNYT